MPEGAAAAAGQGAPPTGQPQPQVPFGASPATGPTPNRGYEAAAKQQLGVILHQLERMVPLVGSTSELGKDVMKMIQMASKHIQPGETSPAAEKNVLNKSMMQNQQNMQAQQMMRAQQARPQGAGGGAPGAGAAQIPAAA